MFYERLFGLKSDHQIHAMLIFIRISETVCTESPFFHSSSGAKPKWIVLRDFWCNSTNQSQGLVLKIHEEDKHSLDIHFNWESYNNLKNCLKHGDSITI